MTRDDIIRMARDAGYLPLNPPSFADSLQEAFFARFAALVAAAEREECAKVCDFEVTRLTAIDEPRPALAVGICAADIRARGNT